jgi:hypothetical protein
MLKNKLKSYFLKRLALIVTPRTPTGPLFHLVYTFVPIALLLIVTWVFISALSGKIKKKKVMFLYLRAVRK